VTVPAARLTCDAARRCGPRAARSDARAPRAASASPPSLPAKLEQSDRIGVSAGAGACRMVGLAVAVWARGGQDEGGGKYGANEKRYEGTNPAAGETPPQVKALSRSSLCCAARQRSKPRRMRAFIHSNLSPRGRWLPFKTSAFPWPFGFCSGLKEMSKVTQCSVHLQHKTRDTAAPLQLVVLG
jgi:hypothetical protein